MEEYLSGEDPRAQQLRKQPRKQHWYAKKLVLIGLGVLLLAVIFYSGQQWQKHQASKNNLSQADASLNGGGLNSAGGGPTSCTGSACGGPQSQSGFGVPPVIGKVTAVSSTSITVQPTDGSAVKTFSITSATQEMQSSTSPTAYNASDVHVGDTVGVVASNSDSSQAQIILPNYQTVKSTNQ